MFVERKFDPKRCLKISTKNEYGGKKTPLRIDPHPECSIDQFLFDLSTLGPTLASRASAYPMEFQKYVAGVPLAPCTLSARPHKQGCFEKTSLLVRARK